ncbi:Hypothetical protein DEACI_2102 [Acididesulfobacillus acetoxydans]|uniref:Uncharacterized protein n=1 Tax=Acididesulfobacillus acetoxydans TaxID=1561005 RepID=A0A8S0Y305_9FIRM|nr:Hypothetical protein DEACI_2102 [Acididesulfobacillus acetoxydans]CEJ08866.1 Hypothetical protein DEACI_3347 [Acididesulfobacillus acetoxydans]
MFTRGKSGAFGWVLELLTLVFLVTPAIDPIKLIHFFG